MIHGQAYALINCDVKISCVNITGKNLHRQEVLATQMNSNVRDNISNVFGSKFLKTLLAVDIALPFTPDAGRIVGFISKVDGGTGRSNSDRQFFFVNGRPVDLPNVAFFRCAS